MISQKANQIFQDVIETYHIKDKVDQAFKNPYDSEKESAILFAIPQMLDRYRAVAL